LGGATTEWLKRNRDLMDWECLASECMALDSMPVARRQTAAAAFRSLKSQFDGKFLDRAFRVWHPITAMIMNTAPWTRDWVIWLAEAMADLRTVSGFAKVRRKYATTRGLLLPVTEAESLLWLGHKLKAHGLDLCYEPKVESVPPVPDMLARHVKASDELFVEVTELLMSCDEIRASAMWEQILRTAAGSGLEYRFKCYGIVEGAELQGLVGRVRATLESALAEHRFVPLDVNGILKLGLAPKRDAEALKTWSESTGVRSLEGAPVQIDELSRIKNKLRAKSRQFVPGRPNLLVIHSHHLVLDDDAFATLVMELRPEQERYPDLVGTLVYSSGEVLGDAVSGQITTGEHWFVGDVTPRVAFVSNASFCGKFSADLRDALKGAFSTRTAR
jgi:hypothetical protein